MKIFVPIACAVCAFAAGVAVMIPIEPQKENTVETTEVVVALTKENITIGHGCPEVRIHRKGQLFGFWHCDTRTGCSFFIKLKKPCPVVPGDIVDFRRHTPETAEQEPTRSRR